jgi:hypothetical protein
MSLACMPPSVSRQNLYREGLAAIHFERQLARRRAFRKLNVNLPRRVAANWLDKNNGQAASA